MWPLLLCSLAVIFLAVERYMYYRQAISDTKFVMLFCKEMTRGNVSEAAELAEEAAGSAAKLAKDILSEKDSLGRSLESVTYEKTDRYLYDGNLFIHDGTFAEYGRCHRRIGGSADYDYFRIGDRDYRYAGTCLFKYEV